MANVNTIPQIKTRGITLTDRAEYLALAHEDVEFRKDFVALCAINPVFCISTSFWIFEPRATGSERDKPFILRPFQEEFVEELVAAIDGGYDLLCDKTREMGATWCVLAVLGYKWLFENKFTAQIISYKRDLVDKKGSSDPLFAKLDYLVEMLKVDTPFLFPSGFSSAPPHRVYMTLLNPVTQSVITGNAPTAGVGRAGRQKCIFADELPEWPFQDESWTAMSKTTDCRIAVGTPKGPSNLFARLANPKNTGKNGGKAEPIVEGTKPRKKISLHWKIDPTKNRFYLKDTKGNIRFYGNGDPVSVPHGWTCVWPWYEQQKVLFDYDRAKLAQEIDIDYNRSTEGQMYPQIERARHLPWIPFNPDRELYCVMDFGVDDATSIGWFQYDQFTRRWQMLDYLERAGKSIFYYIPFIKGGEIAVGAGEGYTPEDLEIIERHSGWWPYYTDFFGDPAGKSRNQVTATSVSDALAKHHIFMRFNDAANHYEPRYNAARHLLPMLDINVKWCSQFIEHMRGARFQTRTEASESASARKPVHDKTSHARSMFEYLAVCNPHVHDPSNPQSDKSIEAADLPYLKGFFGDLRRLQALASGEVEDENRYATSDFGGY